MRADISIRALLFPLCRRLIGTFSPLETVDYQSLRHLMTSNSKRLLYRFDMTPTSKDL